VVDRQTYVFKTAGQCAIRADVYAPPGQGDRPVIVWIHGGALMLGSRRDIHPGQLERYLDAGYAVVAIDYRLAPETKLPQILPDVLDAIAWVRSEGPRSFGIDPEGLAVVGHSAGGYLTLLTGCHADPRPRALVAFYGYGDITGDWYSKPSPFYCQRPLVSEGEARSLVGTTPLSSWPPDDGIGQNAAGDRSRFYLYCRQRGVWAKEATGYEPRRDRETLLRYCPLWQAMRDFPPTLLLHGDADTDVPYEQSVLMAGALADAGVPHRLLTIPGGEHMFDLRLEDPVVATAFEEVLTFLSDQLRATDKQPVSGSGSARSQLDL
jgi:acetyl esterase/lipase